MNIFERPLWALRIAILTIYVCALVGNFVHDDIPAILRNPDTHKFNLTKLFTSDYTSVYTKYIYKFLQYFSLVS